MDLLIVGLGNPSRQYDKARHNVGFDFIEHLAKKYDVVFKKGIFSNVVVSKAIVNGHKLFLAMPQTYMNNSGQIFPSVLKQTNLDVENLLVVCDNLDLPPGQMRLKKSGSSGGQKGLASISSYLHTNDFKRLFIGIGRPVDRADVVDYVLSRHTKADEAKVKACFEAAESEIETILEDNLEGAIARVNSFKAE